jgi:hypothetical protein
MAKEKVSKSPEQPKAESAQPVEKVAFLTWFSHRVHRPDSPLKAHHMSGVKAYFTALGLQDDETAEAFEKALKVYGL